MRHTAALFIPNPDILNEILDKHKTFQDPTQAAMTLPKSPRKKNKKDSDDNQLQNKEEQFFFKTKNRDPYTYIKPAEAPPVGRYRLSMENKDEMMKINYPKSTTKSD